jgi:hypothetical protein
MEVSKINVKNEVKNKQQYLTFDEKQGLQLLAIKLLPLIAMPKEQGPGPSFELEPRLASASCTADSGGETRSSLVRTLHNSNYFHTQ